MAFNVFALTLLDRIDTMTQQIDTTKKIVETDNPRSNKWVVLIVTVVGSFLSSLMMSGLNVAMPAMQDEFSLTPILLSWIPTSYLLANAVFLLPTGRLSDIIGRRRVYLIGMALFALGSLGCGLAPSAPWLFAARGLQGIGAAMHMATGMAIISSVFPPKERGMAFGWATAAVYIGLSAGPFLGGLLTDHVGWRSIFLINAPLSFTIFLAAILAFKDNWAQAKGQHFDLAGSVVYGLGLILLMLSSSSIPSTQGWILLLAGTAVQVWFVRMQARGKEPMIDIRLFTRNRVFSFSGVAALINYASTFAVSFLLSLYLQGLAGFSAERTGLILISQPLAQALFSPIAGRLSDRIEPRFLSSTGMALTALGMAPLALIEPSWPISWLIGFLVVQGIGFGLFSSPNTNAMMGSVPPKQYGSASGTVATMRILGMMVSMMITAVLFGMKLSGKSIGPEQADDFLWVMHTGFSLFVLMCLVGIGFSAVRGTMHQEAS